MPNSENPRRPAGRRSRPFLPGLVGDRVAARLRRRRGPVAAPTEPLETRLLLAAAPIDTLAYDADARDSKQWVSRAEDNYMVQTFTVEEPSALTSVTFALRGEGRYSDYSGEDLDEFRVLLMTTDEPGLYTPELRGVLAEVSTDGDGNALTVKDLADEDGDGTPGVLVTVDFTGHPAAADLRVGDGYAIVLDTFTGPRAVPGQDAGSGFEVGRTLDDGYAAGDAYFKSVFSQYENDTRAEHFAQPQGWSRFSYSRDLRLRLEFGEPAAVDRPPVAVAGWVSLREGESATLDASGTLDEPDDLAANTYEWDLNGDGVYGDAVGFTTTLTWDELKGANPRFNGDDRSFSQFDLGLRVTDAQGRTSTDVGTLAISDAIPVLDDSVTDFAAEEGREFSLDLAATDPNADDRIFEWVVRWGDGNHDLLRGTAPTATHTYADDGDYEVSFNIYSGDQGGANPTHGRNDLARTITATVTNVAPTLDAQLDPDSAFGIDEGGTAYLGLGATDPGDDTIAEWLVDWGDGTDITRFAGASGTVSHTYGDDGEFQILATAVDEDGAHASEGPVVRVANVAPAVTLTLPETMREGERARLRAASTDPAGFADPRTLRWTITGPGGEVVIGPDDPRASDDVLDFTAPDDGTYAVSVTVDDGDGGVTTAAGTIAVGNVAPTLEVVGLPTGPVGEGDPVAVTAVVADPAGANDPPAVTWEVRDALRNVRSAGAAGPDGAFTFRLPNQGRWDLVVTADDGDGGVTTRSFAVEGFNRDPVLARIDGPEFAFEGRDRLEYSAVVSDPGVRDRLSYRWQATDATGRVIEAAGGETFRVGAFDDGEITVSLSVRDGEGGVSQTRTKTVTVANLPPEAELVLPTDAVEGSPVRLSAVASDPAPGGRDPLTYAWRVFAADGRLAAFGDGPTLEFAPADDGTFDVTLTVSDDDGGATTARGVFAVGNVAPAVTIGGPDAASEGDRLEFTAAVADPAGANDPPRISWVILDENGFGAGDGVGATAAFVPRDDGVYTVRATVDDGDGGVTVAEKTLTVGNVDPTVTFTAVPDGPLGEGEVFLFRADTVDPSRDTLTTVWTIRDGDGAVLRRFGADAPRNITGIAFAPPNEGTYTVEVVATDDDGGTGSATYTVEAVNLPPVVGPITGPAALNEGEAFTFDAAVTDPGLPDTFDLAWTLRNADTGAVVASSFAEDRAAGLPFEHFAPDDGNYVVTVTATDAAGASTSVSQSITVSNLPPVVTLGPAPGGAVEGRTVRLTGAAEDPLNLAFPGLEEVTLSWTVAGPDGAEVDSGTGGAIAFDPPDDGDYTVTLTAADDDGGTATAVRTVSVANVDPVPDAFIATFPRQEGGRIEFWGGATDVDADALSYAWTVTDAAGAVVHGSDEQNTAFTPADDGVYRLTLTVTDDDGGSGTEVTDFTVDNVDPNVTTSGPLVVDEGSEAAFTASTFDPAGAADPLTLTWAVTGPDGEPAAGGSGDAFAFTPGDDGEYTVVLTVDDGDGGVVTSTRTLSVANVAPTVTLDLPADMAEGQVRRLRLSSADPAGFNDERRITFTVADAAGTVVADGRGDDVLDFRAADDGLYTVTATVDDGDGGVTTVTETLAVANLDPVIAELSFSGSEGSQVTDSSRIYDPAGANDPLTYVWTVTDAAGATVYTGGGPTLGFTPADDGVFTAFLTVTDDDGGSATASETFTVRNVDPRVRVERVGRNGVEGRFPVYLADIYLADDPGDDAAIDFTVDWGDGTVETFAAGPDGRTGPLEHTYADDGAYEILVTGRDEDGTYAFPAFTDEVSNVTPVIDLPTILASQEGATLAFELTAADPAGANDPQTWSWALSDPAGTVVASGADPFVSHTFPDDGDYSLTVTVDDGDGGVATKTAAVQVRNLAPTVEIAGLPADAAEGDAVTATLLGTDPAGDGDPLTFAWAVTNAAGATIASGTGPDVAFAPADDGVYTLTATADDGDGGVTTASETLTVANVAPAVTVEVLENEPEGKTLVLNVAAADPGADTVAAISVDWGDGTTAAFAAGEPVAHSYADDGTYKVNVTVTDEDGTFAAAPLTLFVGNLDPVIRSFAGTDLTLRGREATFSGVATDPGAFDVLTAMLDWGDGTSSAVTVGPDGAFFAAHTYADAADYAVTLTVDDGDGGTATATATVAVRVAAVLPDDLYGGSALFVAGTAGNDTLKVRRNAAGEYVVKDGGAVVGRFDSAGVGRVVIDAGAGHDRVSVGNSVRVAAWIDGGEGNDYLRGGGGADVIDGGAGHDLLAGRGGRDVLIGGTGTDLLFGQAGQDILIGGTVDFTHPTAGFASNADGLKFVTDTWAGSGSLPNRFRDLAPVLERNETVLDDDSTDLLVGGRGVDWFFDGGGRDAVFDNPWASIFEDDLDWLLAGN